MKDVGYGLIHGGLHGGWCWDALRCFLEAPSIAVDLPGRSGSTAELAAITHKDWVAAATTQISALPSREIVLVAHSLGGITAPEVARALPDRVVAMVFVACLVPENGSTASGGNGIDAAGPVWPVPPLEICRSLLCTGMSDAAADTLLARLNPEPAEPMRTVVSRVGLPNIPVLYLAGLEDQTGLGSAEYERLRADLPRVFYGTVPGGHNMIMTHPEPLADAIRSFVSAQSIS